MLLSLIQSFETEPLSNIDYRQLTRQRNRAASRFADHNDLIHLISRRLLERLDLVTIEPELILELGSLDGRSCRALKDRYRKATVIGVEPGLAFCRQAAKLSGWFNKPRYACAQPEKLPLPDDSVDLVVVNLFPVWYNDPTPLIREINRVLSAEGLLLFTSLGPDTLAAVVQAWQQSDPDTPHVMPFSDMHDIGDALTRCGFHNIVMENEPLNIEYPSVSSLHDDLRLTGHANLAIERRKTLTGKQRFQRYKNSLQEQLESGKNITYDVVFGHGWKGIKQPKHAINAIPEAFEPIPIKSID